MDEYVWLKRASAAAQSVLDSYSGVGQSADIPLASDEIPASLLKANLDGREPDRYQTNGPCVECGCDTENVDDADFICEGCLEEARAATREDQRLDSPSHVPYANLGRK